MFNPLWSIDGETEVVIMDEKNPKKICDACGAEADAGAAACPNCAGTYFTAKLRIAGTAEMAAKLRSQGKDKANPG